MGDNDESFKLGFSIWLSICFVLCIWFLKNFIRGRRLFQKNLHVIEDGLKRMQEEMELRQRQKSIGFDGEMEDIAAFLKNVNDPELEEKQEETGLLENAEELKVGNVELEEEDDKKNV